MNFKETEYYFYFLAEASNETLDVKGQIVWQEALLNSKKYFLDNGVISMEHKHWKRLSETRITKDERYVIGEPISVYTDGKSTMVEGKLYKSSPFAKPIIELLRRESNKVKASIGGFYPGILNAPGKQIVTSFLWNDLALTTHPVNNSLKPVRGIKLTAKAAQGKKKTVKLDGIESIKIKKGDLAWLKRFW